MAVLLADTAWVDPRAVLEDGVEVGPYCVIGAEVKLGRGTRLSAHVHLEGPAVVGAHNHFSPFCALGAGRLSEHGAAPVEIGDHNTFREGVVVDAGDADDQPTRIGSHNTLHPGVQIGPGAALADHIRVGSHSVLGQGACLESHVNLQALVVVHKLVTVGACAFVTAQARILHDVPPFMLVDGQPARVRSIHAVGLKRLRLDKPAIEALHEAHRLLFRARMAPRQATDVLTAHGQWTPEVQSLLAFMTAQQAGRHGRARERRGQPDQKHSVQHISTSG